MIKLNGVGEIRITKLNKKMKLKSNSFLTKRKILSFSRPRSFRFDDFEEFSGISKFQKTQFLMHDV